MARHGLSRAPGPNQLARSVALLGLPPLGSGACWALFCCFADYGYSLISFAMIAFAEIDDWCWAACSGFPNGTASRGQLPRRDTADCWYMSQFVSLIMRGKEVTLTGM